MTRIKEIADQNACCIHYEAGKKKNDPRMHQNLLINGRVAGYIKDPAQKAADSDGGSPGLPKERRQYAWSRHLGDKKADPGRDCTQQQRPREEKSHKGGVNAVGEHIVDQREHS